MMFLAVIERDNIVIPLDFEPIENEIVYDKTLDKREGILVRNEF